MNNEKSNKYPANTREQIKYMKSIINNCKFKISVIIPVYNVENYIRAALDSIVTQTIGLENLEVLMVNDCSTDKSGKIINEYAAKYNNFKALHLDDNSGAAGKPRNVGMANAHGKYLMFLDPDDSYEPNACEVLYNKIEKEDVDIVFSRYKYIFEDRKTKCFSVFEELNEVKIDNIQEEPRLFTLPPSVWTKIFKREFIEKNDIKFPEGIPGQDLYFVVKSFLEANGILFLNNQFLFNYNRIRDSKGDESISRDKNKKNLMGMIQAYKKAYELLKKYKKVEYSDVIFKNHLQFWMEGFILSKTTSTEKKELLEEVNCLFEEFEEFNSTKQYINILFNKIHEKKYDEAILIADALKEIIISSEREKSKLKNRLKTEKKNLAQISPIKGYLTYKSKNIFFRSINKVLFKLKLTSTKEKINDTTFSNFNKENLKKEIVNLNPFENFKDLTLILPYRKTNDPEREMNLDISLKYLGHIGIHNIIISEHSDISNKEFLKRNYEDLFKSFKVLNTPSYGKPFNLAKSINNGVIESETKYIGYSDIDCLTKRKNIALSLFLLRRNYDVVHPFKYRVTDIIDKNEFDKKYDFKTVKSEEQNRPWADGGIVFWNKNSFISIGMQNENFSGWGGEDNELMTRANLFNLKMYRIDDTLYHLYHHRPQIRTKNNAELLRKSKEIKDSNIVLNEINKWPWVVEAKKSINLDKSSSKEYSNENLDSKAGSELNFWLRKKNEEGVLKNEHYEYFYTGFFGLDKEFFFDKKILDIGCGPRGSLEWADGAKERIGLDPLADSYTNLGTTKHKMKYVCSGSEDMPFPDNYFDVVCSFNSLDHLDNLDKSITEIKRVIKKGGLFLLISDVNHDPTPCEPIVFSFDITKKFKPLLLLEEKHFEKIKQGVYQSLIENVSYDHSNKKKRYGIITAKFKKT